MPEISLFRPIALSFALACLAAPLSAQTAPGSVETPVVETVQGAGECPAAAAMAEPATPETASADGTAPDNSGSTGWTGGTGGSQIGTNPSGAHHATRTWHPPTARGLDLAGRPEPVPAC